MARVRRPPGDDHLRAVLVGQPRHLVHVHQVIVFADVVGHGAVQLTGEVEVHAVGEVAAVREGEPEDRVTGPQERRHGGRVRLGARMRLHVRVIGVEQHLQAVDRQLLGLIHVLAAAVVPTPGVALRVLVGHDRALGLHDGERGEVLARDHLQGRLLPRQLRRDRGEHLGVCVGEAAAQHRVGAAEDVHGTHRVSAPIG